MPTTGLHHLAAKDLKPLSHTNHALTRVRMTGVDNPDEKERPWTHRLGCEGEWEHAERRAEMRGEPQFLLPCTGSRPGLLGEWLCGPESECGVGKLMTLPN